MADFTAGLHSMRPPIDQNDPGMEFVTHFTELAPTALDTSIVTSLNFQNSFSGGHDSLFPHNAAVYNFPGNIANSFPAAIQQNYGVYVSEVESMVPEPRKRKVVDVSECSSIVASNSSSGRTKKMKNSETEGEKAKVNVVHVRARRGQATDSHSLAERVRRGKINERLRCLQDIVPGCYKTMGLAVMLDEIINYVQSLQNQVEFLSMKLNAASSYYDFNSEPDSVDKMQRAMVKEEAKEMQERKMRKGFIGEEVADSFQIPHVHGVHRSFPL